MASPTQFKKTLLAGSVMAAVAGGSSAAYAQGDAAMEEVVVRGIRGAQETAVNVKRDADSVVDAISAEDIGKLPDVTISDSLQRISGVQIQRSAGEGGSVAIRGLPNVVTQLNGEQYIPASSITTVQPDFGDIPAQLFKGAEVHKSSTADLVNAGITGTINLKTHRPFDFDQGLTASGSLEFQQGDETGESDPVASGLISWQNGDFGAMLSAAYANVNLANYYNGFNTANPSGDAGWVNGANDWGASQDYNSASPQGWVAWNQVTERERTGLNGSIQADLGGGFEFVGDWFYTEEDEYNRKVGMSATNRWQHPDWYTPSEFRRTGDFSPEGAPAGTTSAEWISVQEYELDVWRLKSFTQNDSFHRRSRNANLEFNFDDGGAFTGSFRHVISDATQERRHGYNEGDLSNWQGSTLQFRLAEDNGNTFYPSDICANHGNAGPAVGSEGGCFIPLNPDGYNEDPQLTFNTNGEHPTWSGFDSSLDGGLGAGATVADYMANEASYAVGAFSSENNADSDGEMRASRMDASYKLDDTPFLTSIDAGIRQGVYEATEERYHLFSPFYEEGCLAQWKAVDVVLNNTAGCTAGEQVGGEFQGYTVLPPTELADHNNVIWEDDFGPIDSVPGVYAADPHDYDDPEAFHNRAFGSTEKVVIPGSSYTVERHEDTFYLQGNFSAGIVDGNLGVRHVETELQVKQNEVGDAIPYGNSNTDGGDQYTERTYTDTLPSLNLAVNLADDHKLRFAWAKTMTPLNLNQWGDGLVVNTVIDNTPGSETEGEFIVSSATLNGNPDLDPFRAENLDISYEWYLGGASLFHVGYFSIDVDSFVQTSTIDMQIPDPDGVVRRTTPTTAPVQGTGGEVDGFEAGVKLAFSDFTDGALSNFGVDANITHSPSEQSTVDINGDPNVRIDGSTLPFPGNSEDQYNLVGWYQGERLQARVAYNYRSDQMIGTGVTTGGLTLFQDEAAYVDASVSYDVTDAVTVYLNGSNITGEFEDYYLEWEDQYAFQNYYEPRYTLGVRARF